jgi:acyl-CoA reductase-like NAD-dependent aldehyde dehydrogenase
MSIANRIAQELAGPERGFQLAFKGLYEKRGGAMREFQLKIAGRSRPGSKREVRRPYDGAVIAQVHFGESADVEAALAEAVVAAPRMAALPTFARAKILQSVAHGLSRRKDELARTLSAEAGKPIRYAEAEAGRAVQTFVEAAEQCKRLEGEYVSIDAVEAGVGRFGVARRFPVGPVAAISPFNFPLNLVAHKLAPAIAAGCPVVLKPASQTPLSSLLLAEVIESAGLPEGGLSVVPSSREVADRLTVDARIKLLTFTGSAEVGWSMKTRAGKKRVVLELGGNAAVIVGPDAVLEDVVPRLVVGAFAYAGQICISVQRVFVFEGVADALLRRLVDATLQSARVGDPEDPSVVVGPMIDGANQQRILSWIAEAREHGAELLCGGEPEGTCIRPAVITGVEPSLPLCAEEAFGPIVVVERVRSWDEAIARTNDSRFGLQCGVFTHDLRALWRCFEEIGVGGVIHNDVPTFRVDHMPYGGVKDSGLGREGPRYAIEEMSELKLLVLRP